VAFLTVLGALVGAMPALAVNGAVWTTLPSLPTARFALAGAAAPCPAGQTGTCVYAVGGNNAAATVEAYNSATNA
jgi:hypothetical protein